jgi:hypothetical protein
MFRTVSKIRYTTTKLDYLTIVSHKHAYNLVCNEEKMISESIKLSKNKNPINTSNSKHMDKYEIEWLNKMSLAHSNN